jgi:hypothetical protein
LTPGPREDLALAVGARHLHGVVAEHDVTERRLDQRHRRHDRNCRRKTYFNGAETLGITTFSITTFSIKVSNAECHYA